MTGLYSAVVQVVRLLADEIQVSDFSDETGYKRFAILRERPGADADAGRRGQSARGGRHGSGSTWRGRDRKHPFLGNPCGLHSMPFLTSKLTLHATAPSDLRVKPQKGKRNGRVGASKLQFCQLQLRSWPETQAGKEDDAFARRC